MMTDHTKAALENGMAMEAKKHGMRQAQDGHWTVTFTVHPEDLPADLMIAGMGTRYALTLFEVLDNEELKGCPEEAADDEAEDDDTAPPEKRKWDDLRPSQQAGIICNEPAFAAYAAEKWPAHWADANADTARFVRDLCCVSSRSELDASDYMQNEWEKLEKQYRAWQDAPKHGAG